MYQYEKPECQTNGCTNANDSKENEFQPRKANKKKTKKQSIQPWEQQMQQIFFLIMQS